LKRPRRQSQLDFLEVRPARQEGRRDGQEIHGVRHGLGQRVPVVVGPRREKRSSPPKEHFLSYSSGAVQDGNQPRSEFLDSVGGFLNFFLALEKICAYIRICRRVPKPQEKNPPAEAGAAGNFRLGRMIFAKRGKPGSADRESKFQGAA
jgi:hypothetical protein